MRSIMWSPLVCVILGAAVLSVTHGGYIRAARPSEYNEKYNKRQLNTYHEKVSGYDVVPLQPEELDSTTQVGLIDAELEFLQQQLVDRDILTPDELVIFIESSRIVDEIQHMMNQGVNGIDRLEQLLIQKIKRWYNENGGSVSDITQQIPSFFQGADMQKELNELVQQGIFNKKDIELFFASSSTISKLDEALERGDETVKEIYLLLGEKRALQQQNQKDEIS